ncbi:nuclear pore complex subunit, partial [Coemansia sp. BCRC 34301]
MTLFGPSPCICDTETDDVTMGSGDCLEEEEIMATDYNALRELDRNYTGHRLTCVELVVKAWAHGHSQSGGSFCSEEITLMSQLTRQTHSQLGRSLRSTYDLSLQAYGEGGRWRVVSSAGESGSAPELRKTTGSSSFDLLSRMVASMAQYAAMLPDADRPLTAFSTLDEPKSPEPRSAKRLAAERLTEYSAKPLPPPSDTASRPEGSSNRRRSLAVPRSRAPQSAKAGLPSVDPPLLESLLSPLTPPPQPPGMDAEPAASKRAKRTTVEEKQSNKDRRNAAAAMYTSYQLAGRTIQDLLADKRAVVRAAPPHNCPTAEELFATPLVPIVFKAHSQEPAHYILDCRVNGGVRTATQAQGFHEYGVDGFPVPVVPGRWLEFQGAKYRRWCRGEASFSCKEVVVANEVEEKTCLASSVQGTPMCRGCIQRQTDCPCRFKGIRINTRLDILSTSEGGGAKRRRFIVAPMFASQVDGSVPMLSVRAPTVTVAVGELAGVGVPLGWPEFYALFLTAPTLLQTLKVIAEVTTEHNFELPAGSLEYGVVPGYGCSATPCIYREISPNSRQLCDICATSVMSVCFFCSMCAAEVCVGCFADWDDTGDEPRVVVVGQAGVVARQQHSGSSPSEADTTVVKRSAHCKRFMGTGEFSLRMSSEHRKRQFVRVSQFSAADIRQVLSKAQGVVDLGAVHPDLGAISCAGVISDAASIAFDAKVARIEQRTRGMYPHAPWEQPVLYVMPNELTTAEFSVLWRRGKAVVVRGLLDRLNSEIWTPEWWIKHFGDEMVSILDCRQKAEAVGGGDWPLSHFYRLFDGRDKYAEHFSVPGNVEEGDDVDTPEEVWRRHRRCVQKGILKLKDWPPTDDFCRRLPVHFARFMEALPFPEYTQRKGRFNLANRLPAEFVPPDLGPKMYCAYGSSDGEGGVGTTNLHCDMADAVNIMAYAPPDTLLEESKRLNTHLMSSEIPSVHRGLDLLESESRKLVARSVRNGGRGGGALDPRAQSLLASSGVDTDELMTDNVSACLLSAFEQLHSDYDANVESYLGQMQEQSIVSAIESSTLATLDDFDGYMTMHLRNVWDDTQRRLFEELGQYQGTEQLRPFFDPLAGGEAVSSFVGQQGGSSPVFGLADEGSGIKCTQPRVERYAQVVRKLNDARVSTSSSLSSSSSAAQFDLLAGLEKATADSSQELKSKQIGQVWRLLARYTANDSSSSTGAADSDECLVAGACSYLEQTFIEHVDAKIAQYPHDANVGGVPSVHRRMQGYLKIQFGRLKRVPAFLEVFDNEPIWAHMFLLYRCGYKRELLAYALDMEDVITDSDPGFVTHLKAFLDGSSSSVRTGDVPVATSSSSLEDPYKAALYKVIGRGNAALYKVIGRGNVPKKAAADVIQTTEDYLWSNLVQIRDADKITGKYQTRSTLEGLQQTMLKFGSAHFDPSGSSPLLYFRVLLLCGLFESAIDYLLRVEKFQVEAVHMAIALVYYGLLRLPPGGGLEPAVGGSFASYFVAGESLGSRGRFDFSRMIVHYARALPEAKADNAIAYLLLLTLPPSATTGADREMVLSRQRSACEQAIVRLLYERRDYSHFLGDIQSDGTRKAGVLERFLPLLGITTSEQFSQTIIRRLADRSRDEGRLSDTVMLYNLGERYNTVLNVLCKRLGEVLHQRDTGGAPMLSTDASESGGGLEDVEGVARAVLNHYQQREHIARVLDDRAVSACSMLLSVIDFVNCHQRGAYEEALELIESTNLLPLSGDVTVAAQHAEQ